MGVDSELTGTPSATHRTSLSWSVLPACPRRNWPLTASARGLGLASILPGLLLFTTLTMAIGVIMRLDA